MRAVVILGPNARTSELVAFRRADLGVALTQAFIPEPDADAVLILGGDGTIHRHLARLVETRVPLLPVPGGSANDFARALGMHKRRDAVAAWEKYCRGASNVREVDIGLIMPLAPSELVAPPFALATTPGAAAPSSPSAGPADSIDLVASSATRNKKLETRKSIFFCNIGGAGLDASANRRVNNWPRWFRAHGGYAAAALREVATWRPVHMRVSSCGDGAEPPPEVTAFDNTAPSTITSSQRDGTQPRPHVTGPHTSEANEWAVRIDEPATFAVFANAPTYGDGMKMAPRAQLDDGLLDVCFVRRTSKRRILTFFPTVYFGSHLRLPEVEYFQTQALQLETERPMDVYADGEYVCKTPAEVRVMARALRVIVP